MKKSIKNFNFFDPKLSTSRTIKQESYFYDYDNNVNYSLIEDCNRWKTRRKNHHNDYHQRPQHNQIHNQKDSNPARKIQPIIRTLVFLSIFMILIKLGKF